MNIKLTKRISPKLKQFMESEWAIADTNHYGRALDWTKKRNFVQVIEDNEIVGYTEFHMMHGVLNVDALIVADQKQRQGIGKKLLDEIEKIARNESAHKIFLTTGKNWESVKFYQALGFQQTGELPDHRDHQDFVEFSKFL